MDVKGRGSNNNITTQSEDEMDLRRGPWTVDEDLTLINYIATHGEGRWNTLALSAGLKRTGKSCRLRWLNYLRPDVRRGNITLEEQLLILELHTRWGNRWSKIAQYLPGRTDNEIKNYWRTRVQKLAKQLKCDVNSKQFKDTMRYLWMPRLVERIQAAATTTTTTSSSPTLSVTANNNAHNNSNNGKTGLTPAVMNNEYVGRSHVTQSYTPENSSTSDSFGTQVSTISDLADNYYGTVPVSGNANPNPSDYYQPSQLSYSDCITSPSGLFPQPLQGLDFQPVEPTTPWMMQNYGEYGSSDFLWNAENMLFLQQQLMNDTM